MELSVRDWMIIVGVLLIVVVLLDGFRRMRNDRRGKIRMSLNKQFISANTKTQLEEAFSHELPCGGARVVEGDLQLDQAVPMLMESIDDSEPPETEPETADLPVGDGYPSDDSQPDPLFDEVLVPHRVAADKLASEAASLASDTVAPEQSGFYSDFDPSEQEVVVVNVMARGEPFKGSDLLHILLACDCRFGEMNIFHRYEGTSGCGAVQFSIVNSVEPGVFQLEDIDNFSTPGICFFVSVPGPEDPLHAFDCMVETAQCLVKNLDGELLDDSRSVMTSQTLEHSRQRIRDIVRKKMVQHA